MRRAPIVIAATVAGLAGVLSFHTKSASITLGGLPGASATRGSSDHVRGRGISLQWPRAPTRSGASPRPRIDPFDRVFREQPSPRATAKRPPAPPVNYNYGILSVSVTASGRRSPRSGSPRSMTAGTFALSPSTSSRFRSSSSRPCRHRAPISKVFQVRATRAPGSSSRSSRHSSKLGLK